MHDAQHDGWKQREQPFLGGGAGPASRGRQSSVSTTGIGEEARPALAGPEESLRDPGVVAPKRWMYMGQRARMEGAALHFREALTEKDDSASPS